MLYSALILLALLAGLLVIDRVSRGDRRYRRIYIGAAFGGFLGARVVYSAQYGLSAAGMSLWGFALGAAFTVGLYQVAGRLRHGRWPAPDFPDAVAPALALGVAIQRIGCYFEGCCYGRVCHLPWAVAYPPGSRAFQSQVSTGQITADASASLPVHPTQLYESVSGLLAFLVLIWLAGRKPFRLVNHERILGLAVYYALFRFLTEFLRGDSGGSHAGPLTFAQALSLPAGSLALAVILWRRFFVKPGVSLKSRLSRLEGG